MNEKSKMNKKTNLFNLLVRTMFEHRILSNTQNKTISYTIHISVKTEKTECS